MQNGKQLDGAKDVTINPDGSLFRDGITKIRPSVDPDTGFQTFEVSSNKNPGEMETRYVHVEVLRHFREDLDLSLGLEADDVELIDPEKGPHVNNLRLTEKGTEKVFGEGGEAATVDGEPETGEEEDDSLDVEVESDADAEAEVEAAAMPGDDEDETDDDEEETTPTAEAATPPGEGTGDSPDQGDPSPEAQDDKSSSDTAKVFRAVKTSPKSNFYDIIDPDTEESVLDTFNEGKKVNGASNVEALAEECGIVVEIED